jgi:ABC-type nitrate/sulfonate/bicarbonate transport system substrate-binding protein
MISQPKPKQTNTQLWLVVAIAVFLFAGFVLVACSKEKSQVPQEKVDGPKPLEKVRFGMLPYGDHTYAIIGVKKGWFKDVGIDLDYQTVKIEDVIPYLKGGTLDAASLPPGILYSSYENASDLACFVFGDLFQGFTIMAQPSGNYQSCEDFAKKGLDKSARVKAAMMQLKGKTFAYPAETAIKPFIELALAKGNLKQGDFKPLVLDDPLTVNAMRNKQADFQVGGAPSRVLLEREGFKPILNANDIATSAKPSPDSPELASILEDGWVTTKAYYKSHHDTILRLASVNFRILRFMNEHMDEALAIHMPYLSQVTGQKFLAADGKIIYSKLDPFITFEGQKDWFHNPASLYYYRNVNGSILNNFMAQGIYKKVPPKIEDVVWCQDIYKEMEGLKSEAQHNMQQITPASLKSLPNGIDRRAKVQELYDNYDYLDAKQLSAQLLKLAGHRE